MAVVESLKRVTYESLQQFVEDINSNFAIIENSPLYKGLPGKEGPKPNDGLQGPRGSQFIFVRFANFNTIFGDVTSGVAITREYINTKLISFADKTKLLQALNVTQFVNNDVIVLTNSIMLSFDAINVSFIDTGLAFNEQTNVLSNIQTTIAEQVALQLAANPVLNNLTNIFQGFATVAKTYPDGNNPQLTPLVDSMVYYPIYPEGGSIGLPTGGIGISNHKYYGFSDSEIGMSGNGTMVFGSLKKYIAMLNNTTDAMNQQHPLTSDYAPGPLNLPVQVILQNDNRSGILFGNKGDISSNLKNFGHLFKDEWGNVVLQSSSGPYINSELPSASNTNNFSSLKLNTNRLWYGKNVFVGLDVNVGRNLIVQSGDTILGAVPLQDGSQNPFFATGSMIPDDNMYPKGLNDVLIGKKPAPGQYTQTLFNSNAIKFNYFTNGALSVGTVGGLYAKPFATPISGTSQTEFLPLPNETPNPIDKLPIAAGLLDETHYNNLVRKLNSAENKISSNYWTKAQLFNGSVPNLGANTQFFVDATKPENPINSGVPYTAAINVIAKQGATSSKLYIGSEATSELRIIGKTYFYSGNVQSGYNPTPQANKVLTTGSDGLLTFVNTSVYAQALDYWRKNQFIHILNRVYTASTGTISFTTGSNQVVGVGTNFDNTWINVGLWNEDDVFIGMIQSVQNTTHITLYSNITFDGSSIQYYVTNNDARQRYQIPGIAVNDTLLVGHDIEQRLLIDRYNFVIGRIGSASKTDVFFAQTPNAVLTTDANSKIDRDYALESLPANKTIKYNTDQEGTTTPLSAALLALPEFPSTDIPATTITWDYKRFLTSRHGNFLIRAINNIKLKLIEINTSIITLGNLISSVPTYYLRNNLMNTIFGNATYKGEQNDLIQIFDGHVSDINSFAAFNKNFAIAESVADSQGYTYWNSGYLKIAQIGVWQPALISFNGTAIIRYINVNTPDGAKTFNGTVNVSKSPYEWDNSEANMVTIINESNLKMFISLKTTGIYLYVRTDNTSSDTHIKGYAISGVLSVIIQ